MSDEIEGAGPEQGSESPTATEPRNSQEFFAQVLQDLENDGGGEPEGEAQPEPKATAEPVQAEPEPESLAWVKKVSGNVREDGSLDLNRVADQAFNLNKQNQEQARRISEIERVLKNPIVAAALERVSRGEDAVPPKAEAKKEPHEKTDEEIIAEFVDQRYKPQIDSLQQTINVLLADKVQSSVQGAVAEIKKEFPEYEAHAPQVGQLLNEAATRAGMTVGQLVQQLALSGDLHKTLRSAMVNVVYPTLRQKLTETAKATEASAKSEQDKKAAQDRAMKAKLPGKTTPGQKVSTDKKVTSFADAAALAETELAEAS